MKVEYESVVRTWLSRLRLYPYLMKRQNVKWTSLLSKVDTNYNWEHQIHSIWLYEYRFQSMSPDKHIEYVYHLDVLHKSLIWRDIENWFVDKHRFQVERSIIEEKQKHSTKHITIKSLVFVKGLTFFNGFTFMIWNFSTLRSNSNCWFRPMASVLEFHEIEKRFFTLNISHWPNSFFLVKRTKFITALQSCTVILIGGFTDDSK